MQSSSSLGIARDVKHLARQIRGRLFELDGFHGPELDTLFVMYLVNFAGSSWKRKFFAQRTAPTLAVYEKAFEEAFLHIADRRSAGGASEERLAILVGSVN